MLTLILTLNDESCEVSVDQTQSVNKRYSICLKIHPYEETYPSNVDFRLQNYNKKTTYARVHVIFLHFLFLCMLLDVLNDEGVIVVFVKTLSVLTLLS